MALCRATLVATILSCGAMAHGQQVLSTTGPPKLVFSPTDDPRPSGFGLISGYNNASQPQRWAAVPFRLDTASHLSGLDAYYSDLSGAATSVSYIIWNRSYLLKPTTIASSGALGSFVRRPDEGDGQFSPASFLRQHALNVNLPAGDYYLTIYGVGAAGQSAWIGWWAGASATDPAFQNDFIWRSATSPSPGFVPWYYAGTYDLLNDTRDVYNVAFALHGSAAAGPGDFNLDGKRDGGDFLTWQRALGGSDWRVDSDNSGSVDAADLAAWKSNFIQPASSDAVVVAPEPTGAMIAAAGISVIAALRRSATRSDRLPR